MSKKAGNKKQQDDLESLSLTGSHVGTTVPSARRTGPPRTPTRPGSANKSRAKPMVQQNSVLSESARGQHTHSLKTGHTLSGRSETGKKQSARDEFLALFESSSQGGRTKGRNKKKPTPAWASTADSARSVQSTDSGSEHQSKTTSKTSRFSHSVFMPTSARSTSTVETDDGFNLNVNLSSYAAPLRQTPEYNGNHYKDVKTSNSDYKPPSRIKSTWMDTEDPASLRESALSNKNNPDSPGESPQVGSALPRSRSDSCNMNCDDPDDILTRTYSVPVCNNEMLNSHADVMSQKAMKLNSIANNMTSQAFSGGTKAPLHSMQNSYQNIKPKTPVNEVRQSPSCSPQVGRNIAEDYIKKCNMAATKIQRWYRRHQPRLKACEAAMRRLLHTKRQEKEDQRKGEKDLSKLKEEDRKKAREERARQARQQAIEELQRKREEKRLDIQHKAEQEIAFLQANGKIKRSNIKKKTVSKNKIKGRGSHQDPDSDSGDSDRRHKPGTDRSVGRKVDDIFQSKNLHARDDSLSDKENRDRPRSPLLNNEMDPYSFSREPPQGAAASGGEGADDDNTISPSQTATRTTLDDLMQTLKKLEEEDKFPTARKDKNEKPMSWLDALEKTASDHGDDPGDRAEPECVTSSRKSQSKDNITKSGLLTDEKLHSIMSYLDEVDKAERLGELDHMQEIQRSNQMLDNPVPLVPSGEEIIEMEQASAMAAEVTNTMLSQRMELEEKKRSVQMLQKALNQQRELTIRHARETEKEMKKRLDVQKVEYEDTIKRHLAFIDQLIDDKKALTEKCEELVKELKTIDKKYQNKIKSMQESHDLEMKKVKDVTAAAEKLRREKWIEEKTKKIKEMTVKGLEPEIQRLISKHKTEIKKLKSIHEAELLASDERAGGRYVKMTEELRDQLAKEKEAACARERELARQTYEKQLQQEEEAFQQQRRRLYTEVQEEKERLAQQASRQRAEIDRLQRQLEESHTNAVSVMKQEYEKGREEQEKRHITEIKQLKDQLALEKQAWEENYKKKEDTWLLQKERELKEQVRRERDKDIELVLHRLEEDNQASREECERVAENRIKRIRDKYEGEITELERAEKLTTSRYNKTKAELIECQGENERMKVILRQKEKEVQELKKLLDKLNEERDVVSDVIRQEFADKLVATDEENRRVKNDMSELKARHKVELERIRIEMEVIEKAKNEEMDEVHKRVKAAILKKEEVVTQLRQQYEAAVKRADHLEGLLDQQRKQLLKIGKK